MQLLIILSAGIVAVSSQFAQGGYQGDPSLARILNDQRAHHVAGDFKLSVKQEDGTNIEEQATSADGTRRGSYSYVNDQGQTESVKWEAGPGGFKVLNANNQPAHVAQTAAYKAAADNLAREHAAAKARVAERIRQDALKPKQMEMAAPKRAPAQQQWAPKPQQQWVEPKQHQWAAPKQQQWAAPKQQQWAAPKQQQWAAPKQQQWAAPKQQQWAAPKQQQWAAPKQQQWAPKLKQQPEWAAPKQQQWSAPPQQQWVPQTKPVQKQYQPVQQPIQATQKFLPAAPPTQAPRRFFPPGQLAFSRNQLGFQYNFSS